MNTILFI